MNQEIATTRPRNTRQQAEKLQFVFQDPGADGRPGDLVNPKCAPGQVPPAQECGKGDHGESERDQNINVVAKPIECDTHHQSDETGKDHAER